MTDYVKLEGKEMNRDDALYSVVRINTLASATLNLGSCAWNQCQWGLTMDEVERLWSLTDSIRQTCGCLNKLAEAIQRRVAEEHARQPPLNGSLGTMTALE